MMALTYLEDKLIYRDGHDAPFTPMTIPSGTGVPSSRFEITGVRRESVKLAVLGPTPRALRAPRSALWLTALASQTGLETFGFLARLIRGRTRMIDLPRKYCARGEYRVRNRVSLLEQISARRFCSETAKPPLDPERLGTILPLYDIRSMRT